MNWEDCLRMMEAGSMAEALHIRCKGESPHVAAGARRGSEHSDERLAHSQVDPLLAGCAIVAQKVKGQA